MSPNRRSASVRACAGDMPSAISARVVISRCASRSALTSSAALTRRMWKGRMSGWEQQRCYHTDELRECLGLGAQLAASLRRDAVHLDLATCFGNAPIRLDPTIVFHAIECRVQRSVLDL